jgi:hypothetical protein
MIFSQLPDGTRFWLGSQLYVKTLEDGAHHNAVNVNNSNQTIFVPDLFLVQTA